MFEDEEWNINEDDLKDFNSDDIFNDNNSKTENRSSTNSAQTKKQPVNKTVINTFESKCNVSNNLQNNVIFQANESVSVSQKNVVLEIFKNCSHSQKDVNIDQQNSLILDNEKSFDGTSNDRGKNLILNIFQENVEKCKPIVKSVLKVSDHESKFKRKKNVAFADSPGENNVAKKLCIEKANKSQEFRKNNIFIDQENHSSSFEASASSTSDENNYKKQIFLDLQKSSVHKTKVPRVKQAVIRKFPGPAGILPDDVGESDVIDLESLDENKNNQSNKYTDICSQNTKNLFSTGAWQLMMDDLPADFELYDIATIKENALQYSKTYKKVPYLAGIVQCIDYKPNDPHIILKDLSGKVDARIHHSICKLYPNALGTSTVILTKDVGLIVTSKKFVCIIISLNNLVSIYSDEARLVETPHLKTLFKNDNTNENQHVSQISVLDEMECKDNNETFQTHLQQIENRFQEQSGLILKDKSNVEISKQINSKGISAIKVRKDNNDIHEFDLDENDSWLGVNIDELNSFKDHQFPSSTPMDANEKNSNELHSEIKNIVSKELKITSKSEKILSSSKLACSADKQKIISDKLSAFKNTNEISRSLAISKQIGLTENILPATSKPFELEGNDTDDEILSQLDVDAIAASYKNQNC